LLRQVMAGALTPVAVPSATFEAARDLARAREQVRLDLMRGRHRLSKLLLRHGRVWDRTAWTQVHRQWLGSQTFEHQNTELAFIDNLAACDGLTARREPLDERLSHVATDPGFWPIVRRLRAFRGIDTLSALIITLEVADFTRFQRAVKLGSWLGPVPSREQSGETDRHGSITKTGSKYARRILVEAASRYARPPRIGRTLYERQEGLPDHVLQIARRAQSRLYRIHKRMRERNKPGNAIHRRVRARARLLPLGRRDRPITQTDSPPPARVGRRRAPKSAGTRGTTMGSPDQATRDPRHASAGDETSDLG
jgi:transposase